MFTPQFHDVYATYAHARARWSPTHTLAALHPVLMPPSLAAASRAGSGDSPGSDVRRPAGRDSNHYTDKVRPRPDQASG